jgi:hypothetical protein
MASITDVVPTGGTEGDTVTITGAGFGASQGGGGVTIGSQAASITSWSDTSVVCTVPSGVSEKIVDLVITGFDLSTATDKFWRFELTGIDDADWDAKGYFQYAQVTEVNNRTLAQSHDMNRALERIEWLKRGNIPITITNADSPYTPPSNLSYAQILIDTSAGAVQVNFPTVSGNSQVIDVTKITSDANLVTLQCDGAETMYVYGPGLQNTQTLYGQGDGLTLTPSAGAWYPISDRLRPHNCYIQLNSSAAGYAHNTFHYTPFDDILHDPFGMADIISTPQQINIHRPGLYYCTTRTNVYAGAAVYFIRAILRKDGSGFEHDNRNDDNGNTQASLFTAPVIWTAPGNIRSMFYQQTGATRTINAFNDEPTRPFLSVIEAR